MISCCLKRIWQSLEDRLTRVLDLGDFSVHEPTCSHHIPAEYMADALVPQADAQQRRGLAKASDHFIADARFFRCAGTWRDANVIWVQFCDLIERNAIISMHLHVRPHLAKVLHEIVGKGVVVIDNQ